MFAWIKRSWLCGTLLVFAALQPLLAQQHTASARLVSSREGEAVVQAAWAYGRQLDYKPDCSHLVHEIYSSVGLDYRFATSKELYGGIPAFKRVSHPHPGDLIVWKGHVGIVVSPGEHTFYSSLRSGLTSDFYDSPYWHSRGRARFYRFRLERDQEVRLVAKVENSNNAFNRDRDVSASGQPSPKPSLEAQEMPRGSDGPVNPSAVDGSSSLSMAHAVWITSHSKPSRDEVLSALLKHNASLAGRLEGSALLDLSREIEVVDHIKVEDIKTKGDSGWAELQIEQTVALGEGHMHAGDTQKHRMYLRRVAQRWFLEPDAGIYIPYDSAIRVLANQLALFSRTSANNRDLRTILQMLDAVLDADDTSTASGRQ